MPGLPATGLPTRKPDKYADVDVTDFSNAHELSRSQQLLMADIAESRGDWNAGSMWKSLAMNGAMADAEQRNIAQAQGTPLVEQPPAPPVPAAATTFDRSEPANRLVDEPPKPPEASSHETREFINDGTRVGPDAQVAAQARRNQQLLDAQLKAMG